MRTRRQIQLGLGLPSSEVQMILISGNWLIWNARFVDIDAEMAMARIVVRVSAVRHTHVAQAEPAPEGAFDDLSVIRADNVEIGACWRGNLRQCPSRNQRRR